MKNIPFWKILSCALGVGVIATLCLLGAEVQRLHHRLSEFEKNRFTGGKQPEADGPVQYSASLWQSGARANRNFTQGIPPARHLAFFSRIKPWDSNEAGSGCVNVDLGIASVSLDLSTKACNSVRCPPCFLITAGHDTNTLTLGKCSQMYMGANTRMGDVGFENAINALTIINADTTKDATVKDIGHPLGINAIVKKASYIQVFCYTGGTNHLYPMSASGVQGIGYDGATSALKFEGGAQVHGDMQVTGHSQVDGNLQVGGGFGNQGLTITDAGAMSMDGSALIGGSALLSGALTYR